MEKYGGAERRNFPRFSASFVVSYRVKEIPDVYSLSQTKNVSQGGILLTTNRKFEKGVLLSMSIRFPFVAKRIEVTGAVIDSREVVRDLIYETRIYFLDLDTKFFRELGEFIQGHLK